MENLGMVLKKKILIEPPILSNFVNWVLQWNVVARVVDEALRDIRILVKFFLLWLLSQMKIHIDN